MYCSNTIIADQKTELEREYKEGGNSKKTQYNLTKLHFAEAKKSSNNLAGFLTFPTSDYLPILLRTVA